MQMIRIQDQSIDTDVLVIGSGAAGLRAAIEAKKLGATVVLLSEARAGTRNNTVISKGTIAVSGIWKGGADRPEIHHKDTIEAGRYLNENRLVEIMTVEAGNQADDLRRFGAKFRKEHDQLSVRHFPGHEYPRHLSAQDFKGIHIIWPMRTYARNQGIHFMENVFVTKLLSAGGVLAGAMGLDRDGRGIIFKSKSTLLATGGAGEIFLRTNNSRGMTGDGYAMAYEAGATLGDMEFVQFYPTAGGKNGAKLYSYERYLPKGVILRNIHGDDILARNGISKLSSATRDLLTRTIMMEMDAGNGVEGRVIFDFSSLRQEDAQELDRHASALRDGHSREILVAPTAHYFMGGILINENGETGIEGLYAAGEVSGGIHGANRLGGNSLIEAFVFGAIAGRSAALRARETGNPSIPRSEISAETDRINEIGSGEGDVDLEEIEQSLKQVNWDHIGIIRNKNGLGKAREEILSLKKMMESARIIDCGELRRAIKLKNMLTVSEMVGKSASDRTESRGAHFRTDYPQEDDAEWRARLEISLQKGRMTVKKTPVNVRSAFISR